ncbi:MAG: diacylglycerol kinase [Pseudomonadales bacterium]
MKPAHTGLKRIGFAALNSKQGFAAAWCYESAFRQECVLAAILVPCSLIVGRDLGEVAVLLLTLGLVLLTELLNSAVEAVVDRIGHEHHELAGQAKDMASAAVFVSLFLVVVIWGLIIVKNFA